MATAMTNSPLPVPTITLSQEHQDMCLHTIKFLHDLKPLVEAVASCGIDCAAWEQLRNRLIDVNQNIAANFVTPQSRKSAV